MFKMGYYSIFTYLYVSLFFFLFYFFFFYRFFSLKSFFFFLLFFYLISLIFFFFFLKYFEYSSSFFLKNFNWFALPKIVNIFFLLEVTYYNLEFSFILFFLTINIHLYSFNYFKKEVETFRFLNLIGFFLFFMFLLINTNSLTFFFISWEGIGLFSFLLINFWYSKVNTFKASMKVLFFNRIGDFFFFFAVYLLISFCKTDNFSVFSFEFLTIFSLKVHLLNSIFLKNFIIFSFFIVILSKSAQFGFHIWLLEAMEAPLPASALIHSATLVCAGMVLFFKINLFVFFNSFFLWLLVFWAALTTLFLSLSALFNYDIKKILAYSTGSHVSIMLVAAAGCSMNSSFIYLLVHASSKVFIFLLFGYIIDMNSGIRDLRKMGSFFLNNNIFNFIYIAIFSLSSLPFFVIGFLKDNYIVLLFKNNFFWDIIYLLVSVSSVINYFYMFRLFFKIFFGDKLSFSFTYFKNFFFFKKNFFFTPKSFFLFNSRFGYFFMYFILFNLFLYIIFLEFSSFIILKLDIFNNILKIGSNWNYINLNSIFLFLHYSNSYLIFLFILFFFFLKKFF